MSRIVAIHVRAISPKGERKHFQFSPEAASQGIPALLATLRRLGWSITLVYTEISG